QAEYTAPKAAEELFKNNLIKISEVNEFEQLLIPFDKNGASYESFDELYEAIQDALQTEKELEEEAHIQDPAAFNIKFWQGEEQSLGQTNLGLTHKRGQSVRHGMDYETLDKDAFEVKGHPNLALVIRMNRPPGSHSISTEVSTLKSLGKQGIPTPTVHASGYYPIGGVAHPAMLQDKYEMSSKSLVRQQKKNAYRVEGWQDYIEFFDSQQMIDNGVQSLMTISSKLSKQLSIEDIQFLIGADGNFVVNDAGKTGPGYFAANQEVIGELIAMLKERAEDLTEEEEEEEQEDEQQDDEEEKKQ
ncbi:MAG: hypothetical protein ACREMY_14425, partial [bacterium]